MVKPYVVTMTFESKRLGQHFLSWLCNSGEQDFYDSAEMHESLKPNLEYHDPNGGKFGPNVTVTSFKDED